MSAPFGLDFGNDTSVFAVARNRGIDVIVNDVSNRATPSVVGFGQKNRFIGENGKSKESSNIKNTVGNLKRIIGLNYDDVDFEVEKKFFNKNKLVKLDDGKIGIQFRFRNENVTFSAVQLAAMYLDHSKQIIANETKLVIKDVTIAVPSWYTQEQRYAVQDAAKIAGLNPVRIINEITAAGVSYGIFKQDLPANNEETPARNVIFVDIGHSSYTASVAAFKTGEMKILGTGFDKHFGGRDFDKAVTDHFINEFNAKYKVDCRENPKAVYRLLTAAQKLKKVLSANQAAPFNVESVMDDIDFSSQLTREELEELVAPLLQRIRTPLENALKQANLTIEDIHSIELIGGASRVPCLKDFIAENYKETSRTLNSDEAIAKGAAFICASASPLVRVRAFKYTDVLTGDVNIDFGDGEFNPVFTAGSPYPSTKLITLNKDADFKITSKNGKNEVVSVFDITGVPKEGVELKIKVRADPSGLVSVPEVYYETVEEYEEEDVDEQGETVKTTKTKTHQTKLNVTHTSPYALSEEKLAELTALELELTAADALVKQTEDAKNTLEEHIYYCKDKVSSDEWKPFASEAELKKLSDLVNAAEEWLYSEDGEDAKKAKYVAKYEDITRYSNLIKGRKKQQEQEATLAKKEKDSIDRMAALQEQMAKAKAALDKAQASGDNQEELDDIKMD
ncbi:hypothetical protein ACO0SA_004347 [Hanseniaspora valbyensis]